MNVWDDIDIVVARDDERADIIAAREALRCAMCGYWDAQTSWGLCEPCDKAAEQYQLEAEAAFAEQCDAMQAVA